MKSRLLDAVRFLVAGFVTVPFSVRASNILDNSLPGARADSASGLLSKILSLESVLIVIGVLLLVAVISRKTKLP